MLVITDDSTRADLAEAITNLRAKQLRVKLGLVKDELTRDIDDLLDAWPNASA